MDNANTSKVEKFSLSGAVLFGYHLLLSTKHYIYSYEHRDNIVQMYVQIVQRSMEIERQIAKDHNSLDTFKKKWSRLNTSPNKTNVLFCGSET